MRGELIEFLLTKDVWVLGDVAFRVLQYLLWFGLDSAKSLSLFVSFLPIGVDVHGK